MITTFYSYKGGVGRTQLVANLAAYFCFHRSKKILLMEWDLEAPGLHYYFGKTNQDIHSEGLMELLQDYIKMIRTGLNRDEFDQLPHINPKKHICNLVETKNNTGKVDLLPAGNYNENYNRLINDFNWDKFYNHMGGADYVEDLKEQLHGLDYDYIFIDSRTGISDYSGICNIQLPDLNVLVTIPNMQSFEGTAAMAHKIIDSPYMKEGLRDPIILPVFSRVDTSSDNWREWVHLFHKHYDFILADLFTPPSLEKSFFELIKESESSTQLLQYYSENGEKYHLKENVSCEDKKKVLRLLRMEHHAKEYVSNTILDYNKSVVYGESLLFREDDDENEEVLDFVQLAKNYKHIADYLERIEKGELFKPQQVISRLAYREGTRVLASWSGDRYWYYARIQKVRPDEYNVAYAIGHEEWRRPEEVHPFDLELGERIRYRREASQAYDGWAFVREVREEELLVEDEETKREYRIALHEFRVNR